MAIKPENILIGHDGNYKITDVDLLTGFTSYKKLIIGADSDCYLSPELFTTLKHRSM